MSGWIQALVALAVYVGSIGLLVFRLGRLKESYDRQITNLTSLLADEKTTNKEQGKEIALIQSLEERLRHEKDMNRAQEGKFDFIKDMLDGLKENSQDNILKVYDRMGQMEKTIGKLETQIEHHKEEIRSLKKIA